MHHKLFAEKMYCGSVLLQNCWGQLSKSVYLCISTNDYVTPDIFKYSCVLPFSTPCLSPFFFPPFFFSGRAQSIVEMMRMSLFVMDIKFLIIFRRYLCANSFIRLKHNFFVWSMEYLSIHQNLRM